MGVCNYHILEQIHIITMKLTKEICQRTLLCMWSVVLLSLLIS